MVGVDRLLGGGASKKSLTAKSLSRNTALAYEQPEKLEKLGVMRLYVAHGIRGGPSFCIA